MISEATLRILERKAVDTVLSDDEAIRLIEEVRELKRMLLNKKALGRQRTGLVVRNLLAVKPGEMLVFEKGEEEDFFLEDSHGGNWNEWPEHLRVREWPKGKA